MKNLLLHLINLMIASTVTAQIIPSSFRPPIIYDIPDQSSNDQTNRLEVGDLDGDGKPDIVAADISRSVLYLFRNNHSGGTLTNSSFEARVDLQFWPSLFYARGTALVDIDGDGKLDIVLANATTPCNTNEIVVLRNTSTPGNLSFANPTVFEVGGCQTDITVADIDGDRKPDVIVVAPYVISVLQNTSTPGNISLSLPIQSPTAGSIRGRLHTADIDTDGKPDILVGYSSDLGNDSISVYRNTSTTGNISLATRTDIFIQRSIRPWHLKTFDFDGDGKLEVVISNRSGGISVMRNSSTPGNINLVIQAGFDNIGEQGAQPANIELADLDGDGLVEVIGSNQNFAHIGIVGTNSNTIDSTMFEAPISFGSPIGSVGGYSDTKIADLNADGKPDIISMRRSMVAIYENQVRQPPVITSLSAYSGAAGDFITIRGSNFDPVYRNNMVFFGQVRAQGISGNATSLEVEVPLGASLDQVAVIKDGLTALSSLKFTPKFDGLPINESSFAGAVEFPLRRSPQNSLAISDLDLDGKPDIVVSMGNIALFRNTSTTGILDGTSLSALPDLEFGVSTVNSIGLADVTGDGKADILRNGSSASGIIQNLSQGVSPDFITFGNTVGTSLSTNDAGLGISAGDLNLDGKIDLLYAGGGVARRVNLVQNHQRTDTLGVLNIQDFNTSTNPFTVLTGNTYTQAGIFAADLDRDGKTDFGVISQSENLIKLFHNIIPAGDRTEWVSKVASSDLPADGTSVGMETIDLDGDGDLEIVSTSQTSEAISIYPNESTSGNIVFGPRVSIPADSDPSLITAADLDGDGKPELICIYNALQKVSVFKNINNGSLSPASFGPRIDYPLSASPRGLDVGDIDLDGKPDIVVGLTSMAIAILKNTIIPGATISIDRQSTDKTACQGGSVQFTIGASGDTGLMFQWQVDTGSGFADIVDSDTYSGSTTPVLTISNVTNDQNGHQFRSVVSGDNADPVNSDAATLTINLPTSPDVAGGVSCTPAQVSLTATGAANGNYRWYETETAVTPISGAVNGTFLTPRISTTTTYYVSIVLGSCESDRVPVVATIGAPIDPEVSGASSCVPASLELSATGTTDGNYRWYVSSDAPDPIAGAVNGNYATPRLSTTTTYFVSIVSGTCESGRVPVVATVGTAPDPEVLGDFACEPGILTLMATGGTNGNYRWYETETAVTPISGEVNGTFQTPILSETTVYYVSIVQGACESSRVAVEASIGDIGIPEIEVMDDFLVAPAGSDNYQWYDDEVPIPGADTRYLAINFVRFGNYTVEISNGQCSIRSLPFTYIISGLEDDPAKLLIYPNPFENQLNIRGLEWEKHLELAIYNMAGKEVIIQHEEFYDHEISINTWSIQQGAYVLVIRNDDKVIRKKILKR